MPENAQLWLGEARNIIAEPAAGFSVDFSSEYAKRIRELVAEGYLVLDPATTYHEPIGGVLMGQPAWADAPDADIGAWTATGTSWLTNDQAPRPPQFYRDSGSPARALSFRGSGAWSLTGTADTGYGEPRFLRWITYNQPDESTGPVLTWTLGGYLRIRLLDTGWADLATPNDDGTWQQQASFRWMTEDKYAPSVHWLWVYEVGARLVIRSAQQALGENPLLGTTWQLGDGATTPAIVDPSQGTVVKAAGTAFYDPDDDAQNPHIIPPGKEVLSGTGSITLLCYKQTFVAGTSYIERPTPVGTRASADGVGFGLAGKTTAAVARIWGQVTSGYNNPTTGDYFPLASCYGGTFTGGVPTGETTWPLQPDPSDPVQTPVAGPDPALNWFRWRVEWTTSANDTFKLASLSFTLPATYQSDGLSGTDLYALAGANVKSVAVTREGDLTRERTRLEAFGAGLDLAARSRSNMAVRYVVDGVTRFRGLSDQSTWRTLAMPGNGHEDTGTLTLTCSGLWKRLQYARWPGGLPADGRTFAEVFGEVLQAANFAPSDYDVSAAQLSAWRFPLPRNGAAPSIVWRPGTTCEQIITELREKWLGADWRLGFDPDTGKFTVWLNRGVRSGGLAYQARFYQSTALAVAAGAPTQVIYNGSWQETMDDREMANVVSVIGQDTAGRPLLARNIDYSSFQPSTPLPFNYIGEVRHLIVSAPELATQAACDWACRSLYERHRWPKVTAQWRSARLDLRPGDYVEVMRVTGGVTVGQTWTLRTIELERASDGPGAHPQGSATYTADYGWAL